MSTNTSLPLSPNALTCITPAWGIQFSAGVTSIHLRAERSHQVDSHTLSYSFTFLYLISLFLLPPLLKIESKFECEI
jgi:hypothetical protein